MTTTKHGAYIARLDFDAEEDALRTSVLQLTHAGVAGVTLWSVRRLPRRRLR